MSCFPKFEILKVLTAKNKATRHEPLYFKISYVVVCYLWSGHVKDVDSSRRILMSPIPFRQYVYCLLALIWADS